MPTKIFPCLYRDSPTGPAREEFVEVEVGEELGKLEAQLQDERFLTKAPPSAVEKVRARLAKLQAGLVLPKYTNRKLIEGEWGFEWYIYAAVQGDSEIVCCLYDTFTGEPRSGVSYSFYFKTAQDAENAWTEVNDYWITPLSWLRAIRAREDRESEEAERKEYLRLKAKYENVNPDSTTSRAVE